MIHSQLRKFVLGAGLWICASANATTITIVNTDGPGEGFNSSASVAPVPGNSATTLGQQYMNVFEAAATYWEGKVDSNVVIRVEAAFDPLICTATGAQLGGAGPVNAFVNFPNAPRTNTIYTVAQANSLAGEDLDPGFNDIGSVFNSRLNGNASCLGGIRWWNGIDSPAVSGTISLYDTVLHEIGHGLGFLTFVNANGQRLANFNDTYMLNLFDVGQNRSWAAMNDSQRRSSAISNGALVWNGPNVAADAGVFTAGRNSGFLRIFAPNPYQPGSSNSHWDTVLGPNELMEPFATPTSNSCATILAFKDMGWNTRNECSDGNDASAMPSIFILLLDDE